MTDTKIHIFDRSTDFVLHKAGEVIFNKGDDAQFMYVVIEGEVEIELLENLTEIVDQGGFFGEMALITDEPRSATVRAKTDVKLVPVDERRFLFMLQETPGFSITVMRVLVERLRRRNQHVANLLRSVTE
ncbi:MAG: cyclic nucleotide-binding domain-containing protein [bacterium]|nr:cyclic nucleotide-binding domain-containing protein [bacterium]